MVRVIVGAGLAGTLAGLEAERRGHDFVVIDQGAGATATRAAAGLFNPLTGPRLTSAPEGWDRLIPFYRELEQRLGIALVHPLPLFRPLAETRVQPEAFPRAAPGWSARLCRGSGGEADQVRIEGGGWVDLRALLDTVRARWVREGRLEERHFAPSEAKGRRVLWCGGVADLAGETWGAVPGVAGRWQPVRGDVLTVRIPDLSLEGAQIGYRFLLPLGDHLFRWGATHESDVSDQGFRPAALELLRAELTARWARPFEVVEHAWGVRPASRTATPLVLTHPDEPQWLLLNGLGGRGVALAPGWLERVFMT